jgi:hypothetical protein
LSAFRLQGEPVEKEAHSMIPIDNLPPDPATLDHEMAELSLLLPKAQAAGLREAASQQQLTVAQFLRHLVSRALAELSARRASVN